MNYVHYLAATLFPSQFPFYTLQEVMIFQRVLMDVAVKGRMSTEDEWLLMEWADHRGEQV